MEKGKLKTAEEYRRIANEANDLKDKGNGDKFMEFLADEIEKEAVKGKYKLDLIVAKIPDAFRIDRRAHDNYVRGELIKYGIVSEFKAIQCHYNETEDHIIVTWTQHGPGVHPIYMGGVKKSGGSVF